MDKLEIRRNILNLRRNLEKNLADNIGLKIYKNLFCTKILDFNSILVYAAFDNEVRTDLLIDFLISKGRAVYLPRCNISDETFDAVRITDSGYKTNKYGILEPTDDIIKADLIDCVVVPGIAFDINGNRIGFGKGYYDKFLSKNRKAYKIGICYDFQLLDNIPSETHDIKMDVIVTESRIIYTNRMV